MTTTKQDFDDYLNDIYGTVSICGYIHWAASALKELDPIAYEEDYRNWADSITTAEEELALLKR